MDWCIFKRARGQDMYMESLGQDNRFVWTADAQKAKRFSSKDDSMSYISSKNIKYVFARQVPEFVPEEKVIESSMSDEDKERILYRLDTLEKRLDELVNKYRDDRIKNNIKKGG